tara:strand:+ start:302 stop:1045 length:744 start_codon:yes stop_codon:yes gene_type:complete
MATKFSQFNNVVPEGTGLTDLVGLQGGANVIFPIDSDLLDAVTNAPNQVANDVLYIDGSGASNVAAFINPSQLPSVPQRIALYAEWLNFNSGTPNASYFNIPKSTLTNLPYNDIQSNVTTDSTGAGITMSYNGNPGASGNTTFTFANAGQYKIGINLNFFDQLSANSGMSVFAGIYFAGGNLIKGLINEVAGNHNKNDINYFGQNTFTASAGDIIEIKIEFVGGGGNNPFPATTGGIACSICAELIS